MIGSDFIQLYTKITVENPHIMWTNSYKQAYSVTPGLLQLQYTYIQHIRVVRKDYPAYHPITLFPIPYSHARHILEQD
jgi:hypothetical protein